MHNRQSFLVAATLAFVAQPLLAQESSQLERRRDIDTKAQATVDTLLTSQTIARDLYGQAAGYAIFSVTRGGFIGSGGGGDGVVVDKVTGERTYMRIGLGGMGLGVGGQHYALVILFETVDRLGTFLDEGWNVDATAKIVGGGETLAARSRFNNGVALYQVTETGLMAAGDMSDAKVSAYDERR